MHDPIVEEVRKAREEYARKFNYDLVWVHRIKAKSRGGGEDGRARVNPFIRTPLNG
jgi:hypothetical protein